MVKVLKFGGSSLADANQFRKVAQIVRAEAGKCYVVPSAPGKRFSGDDKVTDLLYRCYELASNGEDFSPVFNKIKERYNGIVEELGLKLSMDEEFTVISISIAHHAGRDYVASRGEYLNGKILSAYLEYPFVDAATGIFFQENGSFDGEYTNKKLGRILANCDRAVIPGFYGSMPNGTIKTFSRGGSDITGSIVARAVRADMYENWTDVSGFLMADPRCVADPRPINVITYRELRELSYMGATVLHEDAIFPVRIAGIPINIRNTNDPSAPGTMIVPVADDTSMEDCVITGIAGKKGFSLIHIEKDMMNAELGFGRRVLSVLEEQKIPFEHFPSGIDTMTVVVATAYLEGKRELIIQEIAKATESDTVTIEDGFALIAVVGRGMVKAKGTAARVFAAVANASINIRMIDQGSSELNIILGVDDGDYEATLNAIYHEFVK